MKRRRTSLDSVQLANQKTDEQFVADYLQSNAVESPWITEWTHPHAGATYTVRLVQTGQIHDDELEACFRLVEETSRRDYENSTAKWQPRNKREEMRTPGLRYVLVKDAERVVKGFTSLLPTYEEGEPVVYCYEVHLKPDLQGTGLGRLLLSFLETVAARLPPINKVMLTCFLSNERGLAFYRKLGFETDPISPKPRKLRFAKVFEPDYVILSKRVKRAAEEVTESPNNTKVRVRRQEM